MSHFRNDEGGKFLHISLLNEKRMGAAYRMPLKRSSRVWENLREPALILFERLDLNDPEEAERLAVLLDLRNRPYFPVDPEAALAQVESRIEAVRNDPGNIFAENAAELCEGLKEAQRSVHAILTMLARGEYRRLIVEENLNEPIRRTGLIPQIYFPPEGIPYRSFVVPVMSAEEWSGATKAQRLTEDIRVLSAGWLLRLWEVVLQHADLRLDPLGQRDFELCPICERVFEKTREDRGFCCYQCARTQKGRRINPRKKNIGLIDR